MTYTGPEIRAIRRSLKASQVGFGNLMGVSGNTVARWERSEVNPGIAMQWRLEWMASGRCPVCRRQKKGPS